MLETVVSAVIGTLEVAGLNAQGRYAGRKLDRRGALICVGVQNVKNVSSGMSEYLGQRSDPERGELDIYGFRMELILSLDVYVPETDGVSVCAELFSRMSEALRSLPSGIKRRELNCAAAKPDAETGMFIGPAELHCTAYFVCAAEEESGEFRDFVLKGVLKE